MIEKLNTMRELIVASAVKGDASITWDDYLHPALARLDEALAELNTYMEGLDSEYKPSDYFAPTSGTHIIHGVTVKLEAGESALQAMANIIKGKDNDRS